jgi:hypothetical protein
MAESELAKLISSIEKAKDDLLKNNFTLVLKLGYLKKEYIDSFISSYPETKKAISYGTERYRELCWETYEDNDPNYCDKVVPEIDIIVYTIPEDKRIIFTVYVDQIGEVYRVVKVYDNAYDFLKAYEEYGFITDNR